jgi:hypothetical protein
VPIKEAGTSYFFIQFTLDVNAQETDFYMKIAQPTSTTGEADLYIYSENAAMAYSQKYLPPKCEFTLHTMTMDGSIE